LYELYIANKNYSSWSLRPWVLLRELKIAFQEHLIPFGHESKWKEFRKVSSSGMVPCLVDGATTVWDSLAIAEYLAERHDSIWPLDSAARTWARCAASEMHSGFGELRGQCSMTCGLRVRLHAISAPLERDIARLSALWNDGLNRFGGPYLAGSAFTAVDAFFAPVAFRIQTYGLKLDPVATAYSDRLLSLRAMREWYADALKETMRDAPHEEDMRRVGVVLEDLRAK
jgi:glutathione S-transferase